MAGVNVPHSIRRASGSRRILRAAGPSLVRAGLVLVVLTPVGCRGPDAEPRHAELDYELGWFVQPVEEGPRRASVRRKVRRSGRRFARSLFTPDPMPSGMPGRDRGDEEGRAERPPARIPSGAADEPPAWLEGGRPEEAGRAEAEARPVTIEVKRGETLDRLARWAGREVGTVRERNADVLGDSGGVAPGDRLELRLTPSEEVALERARQRFRRERLRRYFATRCIERVVVYEIERGDVVSRVAREYGNVPTWLLAQFNRVDFRHLQAGDVVLVPVVEEVSPGESAPRSPEIVDADGEPLSKARRAELGDRIAPDLLERARMALDDDSVFERPLPGASEAEPAPAGSAASPSRDVAGDGEARGEEPVREVVVRAGETLSHYASWSGLSVSRIRRLNDGLDPAALSVGQQVRLPMSHDRWARFVAARARHGRGDGDRGGSPERADRAAR